MQEKFDIFRQKAMALREVTRRAPEEGGGKPQSEAAATELPRGHGIPFTGHHQECCEPPTSYS